MKTRVVIILLICFIIAMLSACVESKEITSIKGVWENSDLGKITFEKNSFMFETDFETLAGRYKITKNEIELIDKVDDESYSYYYTIEGIILTLSHQKDMVPIYTSENLIFERIN